MNNNLDRFGKKDAAWLKENGFQMVARGWVASEKDADFYDWTVYKKLNKDLEIRLQFNYKEDNWSGWPLFPCALMNFVNLNALISDFCPDAETAFKRTIEDVNQLLDAAATVRKSLEEENAKTAIEKSVIADCIKKKLNKIRECLKKGYESIKREDLSQLCIIEEENVNQFLAWNEENNATPLNCTKNDLIERVIKTMNKKGVDADNHVIDDVIVKWLSRQFEMDLEHVLWYFSY